MKKPAAKAAAPAPKRSKNETFKKQLLLRRETLTEALSQSTQNMINEEPFFADSVDQAAADADRTIQMRMKDRDLAMVHQIDAALRRIDAGTYGMCERCDDKIQPARMKAFPLTTLCIDCKAELESEGNRYSAKLA